MCTCVLNAVIIITVPISTIDILKVYSTRLNVFPVRQPTLILATAVIFFIAPYLFVFNFKFHLFHHHFVKERSNTEYRN